MITNIVLVFYVLFDSGSTFSYVPTYFVAEFDMMSGRVHVPIHFSTLVGRGVRVRFGSVIG